MTEPEAGSDLRGMRTRAVRDGGDWVITGTKHFISHADAADFVILFAATGEDGAGPTRRAGRRSPRSSSTSTRRGSTVLPGYRSVSHRGYGNSVLVFDGCRVPGSAVLGEVGRGFEVANDLAGHDPAAGRRELSRPGPARAGPGGAARGHPAVSSVVRSAATRGWRSSSPT